MASEKAAPQSGAHCRGVCGEFHSQGGVLLAARRARQRGFAWHQMWLIGDPTEDGTGAPLGFVLPADYGREMAQAGLALGVLVGALTGLFLDWNGLAAGLQRLPLAVLAGGVAGWLVGLGVGYMLVSGRIGTYLTDARAGTLWLKVCVPTGLPSTEEDRLLAVAELALREAKAESLRLPDGHSEVNSPQSPAYVR